MALTPCADVSAAAWIMSSDLPWQQLVTLGPSGFESSARLRFLPDPVDAGQPEIGIDDEGSSEHDLLGTALEVLGQHTRVPDDCYFCLWDGWGTDLPPSVLSGPKVVVPNRAYFLFRGTLSEFAESFVPDPSFVWPADRAWCVANDVDPHYAGIGASATAIDQLVAHPGLDVAPTNPRME